MTYEEELFVWVQVQDLSQMKVIGLRIKGIDVFVVDKYRPYQYGYKNHRKNKNISKIMV